MTKLCMWRFTVICTMAGQPIIHFTQIWKCSNFPTTVRNFCLRSIGMQSHVRLHAVKQRKTRQTTFCACWLHPFGIFWFFICLFFLLCLIYKNLCIAYGIWQRHKRLKQASAISLWLQILPIIYHHCGGLTLDDR